MTHTEPWWRDAVVYQVYPRSFADSDGDGVGDLRGIIDHLDHLAELGVDVIWLSPIYASPHDDNGYDISDYRAIDPAFGTLADFDDLLEAVHERGMKLVMDLVVNHTSDEHAWFAESASSRENPKRDWYWWRPPREGMVGGTPGAEPNNWGSFFSGSTWEWHEASGQYYLHLFSRKQPDLNWENPDVREAVYEMMRWWLDRGVDGFRMDVINLISKHPDLPDGVVADGALWGDGFPFYAGGPRIHEFLSEMHREVFEGRDRVYLTVGEMPGVTIEEAQLFTDPRRRELDMVFQFEHVGLDHGPQGKWGMRPLDIRDLKASLSAWQEGLETTGWNSLYWNNHDQPRAVSRFGDDAVYWYESATALATVLHLQKGTPFIYQGEELGMTNVPFERIDEFRDIESLNHYSEAVTLLGREPAVVLDGLRQASRDNARTPVQWSAEPNAGFTTGEPWIAVHPNHSRINAVAQRGVAGSVFEYYRALIALRHSEPVVVHGAFELLEPQHPALFAYTRTLGDEVLLVVANLSSQPQVLPPALALDGPVLLANYPAGPRTTMRPWEAWVTRR
ncbi:alpha-glucosidase [Leifsonia sp. H3M29-4]|uniref:glycoside hydrolase family 13 protein n=1 Tax=Salinibacterium metalliresistens TaxID=3031321 RepID=UPI0023DA7EDC|nr:alpha-glucosidase [Salinibacterium metalliresistens]MDF1478527.1 alpha-glucosidase [Salinibacterium metalliresistens]